MTIEELVDAMTKYLAKDEVINVPRPCAESEILAADSSFKSQFSQSFPEAYKRVLRRSNGVSHNGLTIWPLKPEPIFRETIFQANSDLRENFSDKFIYFAQYDEELYVFDIEKKAWCAIEFVGKPVWKQFSNPDEMIQFVLDRAWE